LPGRFPGGDLFRPLPEDEGPLTPGEKQELTSFLRARVPSAHRWLQELRRRDPEAFDERLREAAPRLRQLRRVFERDPELGRKFIRHAQNLERLQRARRVWPRTERASERRERIRAAVRRLIAQNLRIEALVLDDRLRQLQEQREQRIDAWVSRLRSDEINLAGEPEEVRELVRRWRGASGQKRRAELEAELRRMCGERFDREIKRLRRRAELVRESAVEEVDRRLNGWIKRAERRPRHPGARRDDSGRDRDDQTSRPRMPARNP
jgi:hypothetical protein